MINKLIIAGVIVTLASMGARYVIGLSGENAQQQMALDSMAKTLQIQATEWHQSMRLSIERQDEIRRLAKALEETKHDLGSLPSSEQYQVCRQADLPDGYNDRIRRLRDEARREHSP